MATSGFTQKEKKTLIACCGAHVVQDGLVALQYVLLPVLAQIFQLNYAQVGLLRGLGSTVSSLLEIPAGILSERIPSRRLVVFGLVCAGLGYVGMSFAYGFLSLAIFILVAGFGSGFQHSLSSSLIVNGMAATRSRKAMGLYNACGDGGKLLFTGLFSIGIGIGFAWNWIILALGLAAIGFGLMCIKLLNHAPSPRLIAQKNHSASPEASEEKSRAFSFYNWGVREPRRFLLLLVVVCFDSLCQAVILTFLGFVMLEKGVGEGVASLAVVILLVGGMLGKAASGYGASRFGDRWVFLAMQLLTVPGILVLVWASGSVILVLLPLIGLVVQGTSTITYGSVADLVDRDRHSRGYALIYSVSGVASVGGPVLMGWLADLRGLDVTLAVLAFIALIPALMVGIFSSNVPDSRDAP